MHVACVYVQASLCSVVQKFCALSCSVSFFLVFFFESAVPHAAPMTGRETKKKTCGLTVLLALRKRVKCLYFCLRKVRGKSICRSHSHVRRNIDASDRWLGGATREPLGDHLEGVACTSQHSPRGCRQPSQSEFRINFGCFLDQQLPRKPIFLRSRPRRLRGIFYLL